MHGGGSSQNQRNQASREAAAQPAVHLGVRAERDTLYIDKLDSTQSIRMTSYVGSRAPLYCTALGKAILSTMDDDEVRRLYADVPMTALTPHSITSLDRLLEQLAEVRSMGYAVEREESNENVCCVAIPLRNREGRAVYALSVWTTRSALWPRATAPTCCWAFSRALSRF